MAEEFREAKTSRMNIATIGQRATEEFREAKKIYHFSRPGLSGAGFI